MNSEEFTINLQISREYLKNLKLRENSFHLLNLEISPGHHILL